MTCACVRQVKSAAHRKPADSAFAIGLQNLISMGIALPLAWAGSAVKADGPESPFMAETSSSQHRWTADLGRPRIHDLKGGFRALPWTHAVGQFLSFDPPDRAAAWFPIAGIHAG